MSNGSRKIIYKKGFGSGGSGSGGAGSGVTTSSGGTIKVDGTTTVNIDLNSLFVGNSVDGLTLEEGMKILVQSQDNAFENGVYLVKPIVSDPDIRDADADTAEKLNDLKVIVVSGSNAPDRYFYIEPTITTLGTDDVIVKELDYIDTTEMAEIVDNINLAAAKFNYLDVNFNARETLNSQYTENDPNNRISEFQNILNWDKALHPTLYFKKLGGTGQISISYSDADRSLVSGLDGNGAVALIPSGTGILDIAPKNGLLSGKIKVDTDPVTNETFEITFTGNSPALSDKSHLVSETVVEHTPQEDSGFAVVINNELYPLDKASPNVLPVNLDINKSNTDILNQRDYSTNFLSDKIVACLFGTSGNLVGIQSRGYDGSLNFYINIDDLETATTFTNIDIVDCVADENYVYVLASDSSSGSTVRFIQIDHTGTILKWHNTARNANRPYRLTIGSGQNVYAVELNMRDDDMFVHRYNFSTDTYYSVVPKDIENLYIAMDTTAAAIAYSGTYIELSNATTDYYFWFNVDGGSVDPAVPGKTGVAVDILSTDDTRTIGSKLCNALNTKGIAAFRSGINLYFHFYGVVNSPWSAGTIPNNTSLTPIVFNTESLFYSATLDKLILTFKGSASVVLNADGTVGNEFNDSTGKIRSIYGLGVQNWSLDLTSVLSHDFIQSIVPFYTENNIYWFQSYNNQTRFFRTGITGGLSYINTIDSQLIFANKSFTVNGSGNVYAVASNKDVYDVSTNTVLYSVDEDDLFVRGIFNIYTSEDGATTYLDAGEEYYILGSGEYPAIYMSADGGSTARLPSAVQEGDQMYIIPKQLGFELVGDEKISYRYLLDQTVPNVGSSGSGGSGG